MILHVLVLCNAKMFVPFQSLCDVLIFGTICYFMIGLTTSASNFFIYIALLFVSFVGFLFLLMSFQTITCGYIGGILWRGLIEVLY